jgi:hypothetical protein
MRKFMIVLAALMPVLTLADSGPVPLGGNGGKFGDWTAATYGSGKAKACYAFTVAQASSPVIPNRGQVMLTVVERHDDHDEVTFAAGFTFPKKASAVINVNGTFISFYTKGDTGYTSNGALAVTSFQQGSSASAASTGPGGVAVTDNFSLAGFSDAYGAITAACP